MADPPTHTWFGLKSSTVKLNKNRQLPGGTRPLSLSLCLGRGRDGDTFLIPWGWIPWSSPRVQIRGECYQEQLREWGYVNKVCLGMLGMSECYDKFYDLDKRF